MFCGCQFSLYPMSDDFVQVILPAIEAMGRPEDLRIETDDLSTLIVGRPDRVFAAVARAYAAACRAGGHVVMSALFSRGCPGEPDDPICSTPGPAAGSASATTAPATTAPATAPATPAPATTTPATPSGQPTPSSPPASDLQIDAQFSLYPLGSADYMQHIAGSIERTRDLGVFERSRHFCTRLSGDLSAVFAAIEDCFSRDTTNHLVIHLTASKGSPSKSFKE